MQGISSTLGESHAIVNEISRVIRQPNCNILELGMTLFKLDIMSNQTLLGAGVGLVSIVLASLLGSVVHGSRDETPKITEPELDVTRNICRIHATDLRKSTELQ